jgi:hypothetical protein
VKRGSKTEAPFALTSSDGSGLTLASMRSRTVVEGPLALTELALSFENPEDRVREGRFAITLPEGASVSRFAMKIEGVWQEGEVVEKQRARQSYESFLHQRKDPALLEQGAGNQFSARVFPIPGKAKKELVITYAEVIDEAHPLRIRLAGLPKVGELNVSVSANGKLLLGRTETQFQPSSDLVLPAGSLKRELGVFHSDMVVVRGVVPEGAATTDPLADVLFLVDTSAGRALDLELELKQLQALIRAFPSDAHIAVAAFDQEVDLLFNGNASAFDEAAVEGLRRRQALGASDVGKAIAFAKDAARPLQLSRVVVLSDGIASSGAASAAELGVIANGLKQAGVRRIDTLAIGGLRDGAILAGLTEGGAENGIALDLANDPGLLARKLSQKPLPDLKLAIAGANWQSPKTLSGALPGDEFVVFAKLDQALSGDSLTVKVGDERRVVAVTPSNSKQLLERAQAVVEIADLEREATQDENVKKRIINLSTKHRVLSKQTAMVVLERNDDYARFGIDRTATVDVLVVDGNVIRTERGSRVDLGDKPGTVARLPSLPSQADPLGPTAPWGTPPTDEPVSASGNLWGSEVGDALGAGGLGLSGVAEGGGGRGEGIGLGNIGTIGHGAGFGAGAGQLNGAHQSPRPSLRMGGTSVSGRLPPEVIQRIVRQNFGRFRLCYERGLRERPTLAGRVSVKFTIGPDGTTHNAQVQSTTLDSSAVESCIARAFMGLRFPEPEVGSVNVVFPIMLSPDGSFNNIGPSDGVAAAPPAAIQAPPQVATPDPAVPLSPFTGRFKRVMDQLAEKQGEAALEEALRYSADSPTEVLAFVAVGEAAEATGRPRLAARAYGSLLDLWSYRVEMKRFAAQRLERVGTEAALDVAEVALASAVLDRPDHPSGHRLLAYAQLKAGEPSRAFETLEKALTMQLPEGRYAGVLTVLRQDAAVVAAAWLRKAPEQAEAIRARLTRLQLTVDETPSIRFVLSWETDANDVDLHVTDAFGEHASYQHKELASGGALVADVTTGYGPEGFVIPGAARGFPYQLRANYYSRGVMGFGMGKLQVVRHDGKGNIRIEDRPFVIQSDRGDVDLGTVTER